MLPFYAAASSGQCSQQGGTAGFLGKAFDPYYLFPEGDDMNMSKLDNIRVGPAASPGCILS